MNKVKRGIFFVLPIFFHFQCNSVSWYSDEGFRWKRLSPKGVHSGLEKISGDLTGIEFQNFVSKENITKNRHLLNGAGVATGDVDGDGFTDVYFCRTEGPNVLYRNLGGWTFEDITERAGVACADQFSTGAVFADIDGDSDLDLLVTALGGPNAAFLNDGSGRFDEVTKEVGFMTNTGATTMALADVDGDGDLDLYMANDKTRSVRDIYPANERTFDMTVRQTEDGWEILPEFRNHFILNVRGGRLERFEYAEADLFFSNDGTGRFIREQLTDGRFTDGNGDPIEENYTDWGLTARFQDFDNDGDPDLYVCNDFESPDRIWINNGEGQFSLMPKLAIRNTSAASMGIDFADIDRNGTMDFFVVEMLSRSHKRRKTQMGPMLTTPVSVGEIDNRPQYMRNTLFLNRGDNSYSEIAQYGNVQASEWSWSPHFLDVDLDGYEDILVVTGHYYDAMDADVQLGLKTMIQTRYSQLQSEVFAYGRLATRDFIFRNSGDLTFEEVGEEWGFTSENISHGMALADFDNDGDLDVVVNRLESEAGVYRNDSSAPRIAVRLRGDS
ncbi:MAG TPA: VCBS repeat-containing protein, partial [Candidatus Marinimicrobia bacterium]|nr:VCBS repeat-containing protein [Candidatus Neomarinimicrobiota bacterium]